MGVAGSFFQPQPCIFANLYNSWRCSYDTIIFLFFFCIYYPTQLKKMSGSDVSKYSRGHAWAKEVSRSLSKLKILKLNLNFEGTLVDEKGRALKNWNGHYCICSIILMVGSSDQSKLGQQVCTQFNKVPLHCEKKLLD